MPTKCKGQCMMASSVVSRYAFGTVEVGCRKLAAPVRRRPSGMVALKHEVVGAYALRKHQQLARIGRRLAQPSRRHRIVETPPQRFEPIRAVFAGTESCRT